MTRETIIHISDIHAGIEFILNRRSTLGVTGLEPEDYLARQIALDCTETLEITPTLIVVSGDLTDTGSTREFKRVRSFFDYLVRAFKELKSAQLSRDSIIIVPGNHDIDFKSNKIAYEKDNKRRAAHKYHAKLRNYMAFHDSFYSATLHSHKYDFKSGYRLFKFPDRNLVVIGLDSCTLVSHTQGKKPGYIYNPVISKALSELEEDTSSGHRIAVFHHNPKPIPTYSTQPQTDYLTSSDANALVLWGGGVGAVLHGHRHVHAISHLIDADGAQGPRLLAIGAGAMGGHAAHKKRPTSKYQVVELEFDSLEWRASVHARLLDLNSGYTSKVGRGRFVRDDSPYSTTLATPAPTSTVLSFAPSSSADKSGASSQSNNETITLQQQTSVGGMNESKVAAGSADGGHIPRGDSRANEVTDALRHQRGMIPPYSSLPDEDPIVTLHRIHLLRVLGLLDDARDELIRLKTNTEHPADQVLATALERDLDILLGRDQNATSDRERRKQWQKVYNELVRGSEDHRAGSGAIPSWAFDSEIARLSYELARLGAEQKAQYKSLAIEQINRLRTLITDSKGDDYMSMYRHLILLEQEGHYSHMRQYLRIAIARVPNSPLLYIAAAVLAMDGLRYDLALEHFASARELLPEGIPAPLLDFEDSLCHYFLGNFDMAIELAESGMRNWPTNTSFLNNYAFARLRKALRDSGAGLWNDPGVAAVILDDMLRSIVSIGAFGIAHFNYALILFWAQHDDKLPIARKVLARHGREDLVKAPDIVVKAFQRAKGVFLEDHDYFRAMMSTYFGERATRRENPSLTEEILDELAWDVDNFVWFRYLEEHWRLGFLNKEPEINGVFKHNHFATLKRWRSDTHPFDRVQQYGGGGGHFLKWEDNGIVINPGRGFLRNFRRQGYAISEIGAVLVTSSHYSAYEELNQLLALIDSAHEYRQSNERVEVHLVRDVFLRFPDMHRRTIPSIVSPMILDRYRITEICEGSILVEIVPVVIESGLPVVPTVPRGDVGTERSGSVKLHLYRNDKRMGQIVQISPILPVEQLAAAIGDASIVIANLGRIAPEAFFRDSMSEVLQTDLAAVFNDEPIFRKAYSVYGDEGCPKAIIGMHEEPGMQRLESENALQMLNELNRLSFEHRPRVVLGELPWEWGDKRHQIAAVLNRRRSDGTRFFTEDVGLVLDLRNEKVLCEYEHRFHSPAEISEETLEGDMTGPVRHFCTGHRGTIGFSDFMKRDLFD